ncbi:protein kinase [Ignavibacterium sp.]|jgi:serine/threonine protein kinase|uniref:protein kinase domain-containing protein n=1 Tax=Ignavibacterium sp. TaxID=2651167 RepID=UPI0025C3C974|nr:protein kinase [Ignavibacterium sp.]
MIFEKSNIKLSKNRRNNIITINDNQFELTRLYPDYQESKGAHSNLFTIRDVNDVVEERVIKFCKSPLEWRQTNEFHDRRLKRFEREIEALKKCDGSTNVVKYFEKGKQQISDMNFLYYVMEKADSDLKNFIMDNSLDIQYKVQLCQKLLNGLYELHKKGIYHRDIKPDNILFVNEEWKIGDLGLVQFRDDDVSIDLENEFIGPRGWVSPEAMNKFLTYKKDIEFSFDCDIDDKSDIYQLGNLFWFIFQCNTPLGKIRRNDFKIRDEQIYAHLIWMINHDKNRRPQLVDLIQSFSTIFLKYAA